MTTKDYIVVDAVQTAGCISYFRVASETHIDTLTAAWKKHGLDLKSLPTTPDDGVALGRAVKATSEKRRLVRPLERRGAWAVVEETVEPGKTPTYRTLVTVRGGAGPAIDCVAASTDEYTALVGAIRNGYDRARHVLAHVDISAWLITEIRARGGISLRESGGVYFVPRDKAEEWQKVAAALDEAGSSVFTIPAMKTAEAVAAITDAITAEAAAESAKIEADMEKTGDEALGARALKTRVEALEAMLTKVGTYEELIGKQLAVRERVTSLRANVSAAILTVMNEEAA
ncbi:MAG TPA: DUF6744 family protein [Vicinamibacterales bacterium]|jgi:hypothetical protein|nr:DUF6744 family protein [Vicinamibacterales bacterium]